MQHAVTSNNPFIPPFRPNWVQLISIILPAFSFEGQRLPGNAHEHTHTRIDTNMGIKMEQGGNTSRNNNDGGDNSSSHTTTKKHKTKKRNREKDLNNERIGNSGKSRSSDSGESGVVVGSSHDKTNIKKKQRTNRPTITIGTKTNSIKKESIRKESIKKESIKEESIKKESIKIESIKKESIKKESGSDGNAITTSPTPTSTSNTNPTQTLVKNKNSNSSITNSEQQQQQLLFPIGKKAKQEFLKVFRKTSDPYGTISFYQKTHSLHTFLAKGLGTVPKHEQQRRKDDEDSDDDDTNGDDDSDDSSNDETNSINGYESTDTESSQEKETFNPEPVLTFLSHLGISRCEMHNRISTALRIELEDEISRTFLGRDKKNDIGRERLSELLMSAMKWHDIPMIRPVVAAVLRKLGDLTPLSILAGLAKRKGSSSNIAVTTIATKEGQTLVYGDLLRGLGPQLRRLVHEAEFCRDVRGDGERIGPIPQPQSNSQHSQNDVNLPPAHLNGTSLLVEMVRPAVVEYVSDINLRRAADHVWGIKGQHRFDTRERRRRKKIEDVVVTAASATAAAAAAAGDTISTESNKGNESNTSSFNVGKTTGTLSALTAGRTLPIQGQILKGQLNENKSNTNIKSNQTNNSSNNSGPSCAGNALAKIREVVGTRPKILAAILNMLIAEHGILTEVGSNNVNVDHSNADTTTTAANLNNIDNKNKYNNNNNNNVTITTALALAVATTNPLLVLLFV